MSCRLIFAGLFLSACVAFAEAQSSQQASNKPPPGWVPPGIQLATTSAPASTEPAVMSVRLYTPGAEATDDAPFPVVVEVRNGTEVAVTFPPHIYFEFKFDDPNWEAHPILSPVPREDVDDVAVVLHLKVPFHEGFSVGQPMERLFKFTVVPDASGITKSNTASATLAPKASMFGRIDLGPHQLPVGQSSMIVTLKQYGKVIADAPAIHVTRASRAGSSSRPTGTAPAR